MPRLGNTECFKWQQGQFPKFQLSVSVSFFYLLNQLTQVQSSSLLISGSLLFTMQDSHAG